VNDLPGPITHLKVANEYYNRINNNLDESLLYLGSICPDSVNVNGHAPKEVRWPAHLRDSDLNVWLENAKMFYAQNKVVCDASYLTGYILHILTDIMWDLKYDRALQTVMLSNGVQMSQLKIERWNELYGFEQGSVGTSWLEDALSKLKVADVLKIGTLTESEITVYKYLIVQKTFEKGVKPRFIDAALMDEFYDDVLEISKEILK
jgi:hypothetical protein